MANDVSLPNMQEPVFPGGKPPTHAYRKFFERLSRVAAEVGDAALQAQITEIAARVSDLEADGGSLAQLIGENGIKIFGEITDEVVRIRLTAVLANLVDVSDAAPADRDRLAWDAALGLWKPAPASDFPAVMARISLGF